MTQIKLCGLSRQCDIIAANRLMPEYIGFVFYKKSHRYVTFDTAAALKRALNKDIKAVGVFVDEPPENIARLLNEGIIDMAQLHGKEDDEYITRLRALSQKPLIKAIRIKSGDDIIRAKSCGADYLLLDAGMGGGKTFDWDCIKNINRPYFLAGGLTPENAADAINRLHPFAVDVSSGIETENKKDELKMIEFVRTVRSM